MVQTAILDHRYDIFTSSLQNLEIADDLKRAITIVPLMHVGPNKKGLYWTASMLKEIAPMFRSIPFRYDLDGQEGSSHTLNKLSSPHFDVGWTYSSEDGAWYDDKTKSLWVKGEVTHPDVIDKLGRVTSDGKREVNYASMGVIVEEAKCSICGAPFLDGACENGHERNKKYDGKTCYKVPTKVSRALHAALTNDPADGEAEIKNVLFQEMGLNEDYNASPNQMRGTAGEQMQPTQLSNQIPGGLATSSPMTGRPGMAPSPEEMLRDFAERIKTLEQKFSVQTAGNTGMTQPVQDQYGVQTPPQSPELVNAAPQNQQVQDNMGTTQQFDPENKPFDVGKTLDKNKQFDNKQQEAKKMDVKDGQSSNAAVPVNPEKKEMQDGMGMQDPMSQIMSMLQQILQRLPGAETQDMGKEALTATKSQAKKAQDDIPMEHLGEGAVGDTEDSGNKLNKSKMMDQSSKGSGTTKEIADMKNEIKQLKAKLEIQDNNEIPEFGGSASTKGLDVADMSAAKRRETFGEYGAWDAVFKGAESASRFRR